MNVSTQFSARLLAWFDVYGRKNLPWQQQRSAYRVWLAEIMLQQTQVTTVIPYFERFMQRFPTVETLAAATTDDVMQCWAGLGYYARARNLHACARQVCRQYQGQFPAMVEALQQLPGIGRSTAAAIVAQVYHKRAAILDGNVKRVLTRYRMVAGWPGKAAVQKTLWTLAESLTPTQRVADYTQAIMDLGALICRRRQPLCQQCPVQADCYAAAQQVVEQFPEKKTRAALPIKEIYVLLCRHPAKPARLMLERRPPAGIWGGLWSLPQCPVTQRPPTVVAAEYGYTVTAVEELDSITHRLTHVQLHIRPFVVRLGKAQSAVADSSVVWCDADAISAYGMPRPIETLVRRFFELAAA